VINAHAAEDARRLNGVARRDGMVPRPLELAIEKGMLSVIT
jgi:hypothetical protein